MKWEEDLVRDIRFNDGRDDLDFDWSRVAFDNLPQYQVTVRDTEGSDFSEANRRELNNQMSYRFPEGKLLRSILEIGVENNVSGMTSTSMLLAKKYPWTTYLGVDILDRTSLDNPDEKVYTIQCFSQAYEAVHAKLDSLGVEKIDLLLIDGWHSINQVLYDWEYTTRLSEHGLVVFHDTAYHPGPYYFINALDTTKWNVIPNAIKWTENDYGIGFAWKKN